jgi:hypothetical protein
MKIRTKIRAGYDRCGGTSRCGGRCGGSSRCGGSTFYNFDAL